MGEEHTMTRRDLFSCCATGMAGLGLLDLFARTGVLFADTGKGSLAPRRPHFAPKVKRVINLLAPGGPSQIDTFDPKPALKGCAEKNQIFGEFKNPALPSAFSFRKYGESGIEISELFPKLARVADDLCVIRSMMTDSNNHDQARMFMNCGDSFQARPSVGSWVTYGLGSENQNFPGFIVLAPNARPSDGTNWRSAFLPGIYQGTYVNTAPSESGTIIDNLRNEGVPSGDQQAQLRLLKKLDQDHEQSRPGNPELDARLHSFELAFRMQAEALDALDLRQEPKHILDLYGPGVQARQFLMARRLAERGVRFVQVWAGQWDHHQSIHQTLPPSCREQDQALAALLIDLKQRGMLDDTLVVWGGEFGRTPTGQAPNEDSLFTHTYGRDHHHTGFSMWLAGGGVRAGLTYGATDELGFKAVENPVHVRDLHATILHLLGFDHEKFTVRYAGRDFRLTDVGGRVVPGILQS
jgi:hypothetical protein